MPRGPIEIVVRSPTGKLIQGASVTIRNESATGTLATIYADWEGVMTLGNPQTSDRWGRVDGWLEDGEYVAKIDAPQYKTYEYPFVVRQDAYVGPPGPQGPPGSSPETGDSNYIHSQITPSNEWTITHPLNKRPSVTVLNSAGDRVYGDEEYPDNNTVVITFGHGFAGTAILN